MRVLLLLLASVTALRRHSGTAKEWGRRRSAPKYADLSWAQHFMNLTEDLSVTSNPLGMEAKCQPVFQEPQGISRGLILLQHGFTACAGFWYLMVPKLVQAGWTVIAPNLPGHGRVGRVSAIDNGSYELKNYLDDLPVRGSEFKAYAMELVEIGRKYRAANADKEMALVGCSHGAAVAMSVGMNGEPGTWDRVMLMQPFLAPPTSLGADYGISVLRQLIPQVLPALQLISEDAISWGPACEEKRWPGHPQKGGHGGMCQFGLLNFRAVLEFGNAVEAEARARAAKLGVFSGGLIDMADGLLKFIGHNAWHGVMGGDGAAPQSDTKIQILATENDGSVSNQRIHFLARALAQASFAEQSSFCAVPENFEHTFINPVDKALDKDMWWLDPNRVQGGRSVLEMMVDFVSDGALIPTAGIVTLDKSLEGDPACAVNKKGR